MKCTQCGKEFDALRTTAKFCSPACRVNASRNVDPSLPTIEIEEHIETNAEKEFRQRMELRDIYLKYRFGVNTSS